METPITSVGRASDASKSKWGLRKAVGEPATLVRSIDPPYDIENNPVAKHVIITANDL
jgi:hypothetical protein